MSKNELIEKLNVISQRYDDVCRVREKINAITPVDNYQRNVAVPSFPEVGGEESRQLLINTIEHKGKDALDSAKIAYEGVCPPPKEPQKPKEAVFKSPPKPKSQGAFSALSIVSIFISLFFFAGLIFSNFTPEIIWTVYVIVAIGVFFALVAIMCLVAHLAIMLFAKSKEKIAKERFENEQALVMEKYSEELRKHQEELDLYRESEQAFLNEYLDWREAYLEHLNEEEGIKAQLEIDKGLLIKELEENELEPALAKLNEANDLTSEEYLPVIDKLISFIKSGRADSLKEAINLHEEILFKERELQLEREKEERRQYEAMLRLAAEQALHEAEMEFQREQEAQRQAEERYRRQENERRHREEMELLEKQESNRQAEARREESRRKHEETAAMYRDYHATHRQCQSCANMTHCRMAFQRSNCASYRPK